MSDLIARLRERMDDTARAGIYWIYVKQHEIEPLLDVCEAARVARLTNAGKGYPDTEADVALDAALARLEATDGA